MVVVALELGPITATFKLDLGESGSTFVEFVGSTAQHVCVCVCMCVCACVNEIYCKEDSKTMQYVHETTFRKRCPGRPLFGSLPESANFSSA